MPKIDWLDFCGAFKMFKIKRIYEQVDKTDGYRILVDRLWPRGVSKENAAVDLWLKEIAPTDELRKWFNHDPEKWGEFQKKYKKEIAANKVILQQLKEVLKEQKTVTLLYGAKDEEHNQAVVLQNLLS